MQPAPADRSRDVEDVSAALAGLRAALMVERLPHTTRAQHHAVTAAVNRCIADAVDSGATLDRLTDAAPRLDTLVLRDPACENALP